MITRYVDDENKQRESQAAYSLRVVVDLSEYCYQNALNVIGDILSYHATVGNVSFSNEAFDLRMYPRPFRNELTKSKGPVTKYIYIICNNITLSYVDQTLLSLSPSSRQNLEHACVRAGVQLIQI